VAASIAYGGSTLVRDLISKGLLDELHLFVNPTAIGAGLPVFPGIYSQLQLVTARPFECGVTALQYLPKRSSTQAQAASLLRERNAPANDPLN